MSYGQVASVQPSQTTMIANPQQILNHTIPYTSFSLLTGKILHLPLKNCHFMGHSTPLQSQDLSIGPP